MKPGQVIQLKVDNRYKDGNVVKKGAKLRGNAKTMKLDRLEKLAITQPIWLNPPIIVSHELGEAIKKELDPTNN